MLVIHVLLLQKPAKVKWRQERKDQNVQHRLFSYLKTNTQFVIILPLPFELDVLISLSQMSYFYKRRGYLFYQFLYIIPEHNQLNQYSAELQSPRGVALISIHMINEYKLCWNKILSMQHYFIILLFCLDKLPMTLESVNVDYSLVYLLCVKNMLNLTYISVLCSCPTVKRSQTKQER